VWGGPGGGRESRRAGCPGAGAAGSAARRGGPADRGRRWAATAVRPPWLCRRRPVTSQDGLRGELVQPRGDVRGEQRAPHPGGIDRGITGYGRCGRAAPCLLSPLILNGGPVPVPVLGRGGLARCADIQVGQDEGIGVDRVSAGQPGQGQGTLGGVQGPAPPRPGSAETWPGSRRIKGSSTSSDARIAATHGSPPSGWAGLSAVTPRLRPPLGRHGAR